MRLCVKIAVLMMIILFSGTLMSATVWVPPKINGLKGDIVLSPGTPGGTIADLLAIFGNYWSHSGLLIDDGYTIRHNTMYIEEIPQDKNGCGIPYRLDPDGMSNGLPGIISEDVDTTYNNSTDYKRAFKLSGGVIVSPTDANESAYRGYLELAADKMIFLQGYYRVNAYVDMMQLDDVDYLIKGRGNHCSGTIWYAHYFTGKTMNVATIPSSVVSLCAQTLYDSIKEMVDEEVGCGAIFAPNVADDIANQVTNTFGFDRSSDLSDYWRGYIDSVTAYANAPDHLLLSSFTNPNGENVGVQTSSSSYFGKVTPIEWTDGYYISN
ncbi:MAG: hypothetical protein GY754_17415 [bacterium]|nr:hypothetical protein [bacterium]